MPSQHEYEHDNGNRPRTELALPAEAQKELGGIFTAVVCIMAVRRSFGPRGKVVDVDFVLSTYYTSPNREDRH